MCILLAGLVVGDVKNLNGVRYKKVSLWPRMKGAVSLQAMSNPYQGYTEATQATDTAQPLQQRATQGSSRWTRRTTGIYAGVFALVLSVFAIAGIVWGLLRPTYTAQVEDAETASIVAVPNIEFTAFIWFAITTGVIGATLALVVFLRAESTRGLPMLLWIGVVTLLGSGIFLVFGNISAELLHSRPTDYTNMVGETFQVVPSLTPGSALFSAPFLAVLMYWCATFVTPPED